MSNWITPNKLPEGFWGECFVAVKADGQTFVEINDVKRTSDNVYWYCNSFKEWMEFRKDASFLVQEVKYPKVSDEDW